MIQIVRASDNPLKDKINKMDWLARNIDYISPDQITKCILAFKENYNIKNVGSRNLYI
jgi:hypothetical protein